MSTYVYSYKVKHAGIDLPLVGQQISLGHQYYNSLVELHRWQRERAEAARLDTCPTFASAEADVDSASRIVESIIEEIRKANAAAKRKRATPEDRDRLAAAKAVRKAAWECRKAARLQLASNVELAGKLETIYAEGAAAKRAARAKISAAGLYWGTYLKIEAAIEQAAKTVKGPLSFRRWTGNGLIAVQIQNGMSWAEALAGGDTRLRAFIVNSRGKRAPLWQVWMRAGSNPDRSPIWVKANFYFHRPLPDDAVITWVVLTRRQVAVRRQTDGTWQPYYEWSVQFTIRTEVENAVPCCNGSSCGVDLGWRLMADGGLRVGYIVGDDGRNESITMPPALVNRWQRCDDLQSIRDSHFNEIKAALAAFRGTAVFPDWFMDATKTMHAWKGKGRLAMLLKAWTLQRFDGDADIFAAVKAWQEKDAHLWQYESSNRLKAARIRRDWYRTLAKRLTSQGRVYVENCDWRQLARLPKADSNEVVNAIARRMQRIAAVGMLRECLVANGAIKVKTEDSTRTCAVCGHVNTFEKPAELHQTCGGCASWFDQDENAARVLLARGGTVKEAKRQENEQSGSGNGVVVESNGEGSRVADGGSENGVAEEVVEPRGRWQRRKANRSQKAI